MSYWVANECKNVLYKATQKNFKILQDYGYLFIGPEKGEMACGE